MKTDASAMREKGEAARGVGDAFMAEPFGANYAKGIKAKAEQNYLMKEEMLSKLATAALVLLLISLILLLLKIKGLI